MRTTHVDTSNLSGRAVAGTLRRFLKYVRPHRKKVGLAFGALSVAALVNVVPPWMTKIVVDDFITQKDAAGALRLSGVLILIYICRSILNYINFIN